MINPVIALVIACGLIAVGIAVFWPDRGVLARWLRGRQSTERVLVEDALKHLYDCEAHQECGTMESIASALEIGSERSRELIERLDHLGLVEAVDTGFELTAAGRSDALRVIRIHRLWERYLSDQTGLPESDWHKVADRREHWTSEEEVADLDARTGFARFDPHGDPIPTEAGDIAAPPGRPLTSLEPGVLGEIVHIEDEPDAIYAQLLAQNLHLGMKVRVLDADDKRLRFEADGEEHVLAPAFANNLTVAVLEAEAEMVGPFSTLAELALGGQATVIGISPRCRLAERRRMLDLGILPGTRVVAELRSPSKDPMAYRIRGAVIALRREQASMIRVDLEAGATG